MSALAFKGTSLDQDPRWQKNLAKRKKGTKFPEIFATAVDLTKVNREQMKKWATTKLLELFEGLEDEVLINYVGAYLDQPSIDPEEMQLSLTDMLERDAAGFMKELWTLLVDAQEQPVGIPKALLEATKANIDARLQERGRIAEGMRQQGYGLHAVRHHLPAPGSGQEGERYDRNNSRDNHSHHRDQRHDGRGSGGYRSRQDNFEDDNRSHHRHPRDSYRGRGEERYGRSGDDDRDRRFDEEDKQRDASSGGAAASTAPGDARSSDSLPPTDRYDRRGRDYSRDYDDRRDNRSWRRDQGDRRSYSGEDRGFERKGSYRDHGDSDSRYRRDDRGDRSQEQDPFGRDARPSNKDYEEVRRRTEPEEGQKRSEEYEDAAAKKRHREDSPEDAEPAQAKKAKLRE